MTEVQDDQGGHGGTPELEPFDVLVGRWELELAHPMLDGAISGEATFESLEGRAFLIERSSNDSQTRPTRSR